MTLQSESYVWSYTDKTKPFCGKKDRTLYPHGLSAVRPAPHNGIAPGDTAIMTININGLVDDLSAVDFENFSWAMKFQVVGADGEDSGCAFGDAEVVNNPDPSVVYKLSEFVASGGEKWPGLKSNLKDPDTRIGSLEINTYGGVGTGNDPPYKASIVTLRNGTGAKIEQKMVERGYTPAGLDADGCNPAQTDFIECFIWADDKDIGNNTILPGAYDGFTLTADVPDLAFNSNDGFDTAVGSARITVSGNLSSDNVGVVSDNSHQTITATWEVPEGRNLKETSQMLFRGRYDWECNDLDQADEFVALFYHNPKPALIFLQR